jgi:Spy/CpxP family protein refolding chaperone
MRQQQIGMAFLMMGMFSLGGLTACTSSPTSQVSQSDRGQGNMANPSESNAPPTAERAQKRAEVRKQIEAVLTPEQVQQLQSKLNQGEKMRKALRELNLQADQKTKIQDIFKAAYPNQAKPAPPVQQG